MRRILILLGLALTLAVPGQGLSDMNPNWDTANFEQVHHFYVDQRQSQGNGDLLYNTFRNIIERGDTSDWARTALITCFVTMEEGLRWPDYMNSIVTAEQSQHQMTRDPWILGYACAVHLGMEAFIEWKPPWWLYRPKIWAWRKALIGKPNCYLFWDALSRESKHGYVQVLEYYMDATYKTINQ